MNKQKQQKSQILVQGYAKNILYKFAPKLYQLLAFIHNSDYLNEVAQLLLKRVENVTDLQPN